MKIFSAIMLAAVCFLLISCSSPEPEPTSTPVPPTNTPIPPTNTPLPPTDTPTPEIVGDAERGREIYEIGGSHEDYQPRQACISCHTLDGTDNDGPSLQGISARAGERVPDLTAAEYIYQSIMDPRAYVVEGYPNMGMINGLLLTEDEVNDVVAFLLTQ